MNPEQNDTHGFELVARRDLGQYPYSQANLSFEEARGLGLEAAAQRLFDPTGGIALLHWESGLRAMLANIFPETPEKTINDLVFSLSRRRPSV